MATPVPRAATRLANRDLREGLKENLRCSVCLGQYTDPKILPCHHSFCLNCLEELEHLQRKYRTDGRYSIKCPICCTSVKLPLNGIAGLPSDFRTNSLLELQAKEPKVAYCSVHYDEELKVYCSTCEAVICLECTMTSHREHDFDLISKCYSQQLEQIKDCLEAVQWKLALFDNTELELNKTAYDISTQKDHLQKAIQKHAEHLISRVRESEAVLLKQLSAIVTRKKVYIRRQKKEAADCIGKLQKSKEKTNEVLKLNKMNNYVKFLERKKEVMADVYTAINCSPDTMVPVEKANIVFTRFDTVKLDTAGSRIGELKGNEFETLGLSKRRCSYLAKEPVTTKVTLLTDDGKPLVIAPTPVTCIVAPPNRTLATSSVKCEVEIVENDYSVRFTPQSRGNHGMYFFVGGLQVWEDPLLFNIIPTPETRTRPIYKMNLGVQGPVDITVSDDGDVAIADFINNRVLLYWNGENRVIVKASSGYGKGQVFKPRGVAFTKTGQILVTDSHRLQLLPSGSHRGVFCVGSTTAGKSSTQFDHPMSVAVNNSTGDIFVADYGNNRIQVFTKNLVYSRTIQRHGLILGALNKPCAIAVDEDGYLYVCLQNDHCVFKLSPNGGLKARIEAKEDELPRNQLKCHLSIAVRDGFVYVGNHKSIVIFDTSGKYRNCIQDLESEAVGLDVDRYGDLYVTDALNERITIF